MTGKTEKAEVVDGTVEEDGPNPELETAVDDLLPAELTISDPEDQHGVMVVLDNHDVSVLLQDVQSAALRKWVYELPGIGFGLSIHAVQDITQRMNWTGKCKIGLLPDTLSVEQMTADEGNGPEPFWVATVFARDEVTGAMLPGSSMEPQRMRLTAGVAKKKRDKGAQIGEDNTIFDRFARQKAIQKATRNALASFIPEEIEQTVLAMFSKDPSRVERIQTEQEAKLAEMPPPLDDDRAKALIAEAQKLYDEIRELEGGQGKVKFPPGKFQSWILQSQHSHERLEGFVEYLKEQRETIPGLIQQERRQDEAIATANAVACPKCEVPPKQFCKGIRGAHGERIKARLDQLEAAACRPRR